MSAAKQAATLVLIVWHSLRLSYLQAAIRRQIDGRGFADKDLDESLKTNQIGLQLAWSDFIANGARK